MKEGRHRVPQCRPQGRQGQGLPAGGPFLQTTDSGRQTKLPLDIPQRLRYNKLMRTHTKTAIPEAVLHENQLASNSASCVISDGVSCGGFYLFNHQATLSVLDEARSPFVGSALGKQGVCPGLSLETMLRMMSIRGSPMAIVLTM